MTKVKVLKYWPSVHISDYCSKIRQSDMFYSTLCLKILEICDNENIIISKLLVQFDR